MTQEEVFQEILKDYPNVIRFAENCFTQVENAKGKRITKVYEYNSPKKNHWVVLVVKTKKELYYLTVATYVNRYGINIVNVMANGEIRHYWKHFITRYNSRHLNQPNSGAIKLFLKHIVNNSRYSLEFYNTADETRFFAKCNDGAVFGTKEKMGNHVILTFKTFVSNGMLIGNQISLGKELEDNWEYAIQNGYMNDIDLGLAKIKPIQFITKRPKLNRAV